MKYRINLFPKKEKSISERVIYFALNYLRYILVITQIVVIGVFFYRFKIDQEIIDLKDELTQKQEIVLVSNPLLKEAQGADRKIKEIKAIIGKQDLVKQMIDYFLSIFPEKIKLNRLNVTENSLDFESTCSDPRIIKIFYDRLKKEKRFTKIELGSIQKSEIGFVAPFKLQGFIIKK